jgi:RNA polymerase sigma-70 factor (ECF subfamily)
MRAEVDKAVALLNERRPDSVERALALLQQTVFSFSMRVCGHREDAEDTMQDVLLKSMPYLPKFSSSKALVVWLYTVAKNRCLMSRRRSRFAPRQELSLEELMPDATELERLGSSNGLQPDDALLREENADLVRRAVLKVPPPYRLVLVLHDMEELDTAEVAKVTGLRPGTVRVRLHRARLFVRRELSKMTAGHKPRRRARSKLPRSGDCKRMFAALSDYLDSELPQASCDDLRRHMAGCEPCIAFLDNLEKTISDVKSVSAPKPDARIAAQLRKKLLPQLVPARTAKPHRSAAR